MPVNQLHCSTAQFITKALSLGIELVQECQERGIEHRVMAPPPARFVPTAPHAEPVNPTRTMSFAQLRTAGEPYGHRGEARGLKWRDRDWPQQFRLIDSIGEQELRDTLEKCSG